MGTKTQTNYENGVSTLHIANAQRADIGHFRCIADNRVANPVSRDALLIVKCKSLSFCILMFIASAALMEIKSKYFFEYFKKLKI